MGIEHEQRFCLTWERLTDSASDSDSARTVPGSLISHFPAVVLRTNILLRSARSVFRTEIDNPTGVLLPTVRSMPHRTVNGERDFPSVVAGEPLRQRAPGGSKEAREDICFSPRFRIATWNWPGDVLPR